MIALAVRFLAGRYHATPWGRHVNEGVVEWPPSPWRLLRALVATWRRTMPGVPAERAASLLAALAAPPLAHLPPAVPAHIRCFMPWFKKGPDDRTRVMDTFAAVDPDSPVILAWPDTALSAGDRELLSELLARLPYLGRAESWCEAWLCDPPGAYNCRPLAPGDPVPGRSEPVRVLAAAPAPAADLLAALEVDTEDLRTRERRLDPPGSRWVVYAREAGALVPHPRPAPPSRAVSAVHAVRFALDSVPLPLLTDTIAMGEWARRAALSQYGQAAGGGSSPALGGRAGRQPLQGHRHAFYLPSDEDSDGRIDHLTVYVPAGLDGQEQAALARMRRLWAGRERPEVLLALLGLYTARELTEVHPWCRPSQVWESVTPYLLTRHPKVHRDGRLKWNERGEQVDGPEDQARREWRHRQALQPDLPDLAAVEPIAACRLSRLNRPLRWIQFRRWRTRGGGATSGLACGLRLTFAAPVAGPLALGYGCHYGLGQFRPL